MKEITWQDPWQQCQCCPHRDCKLPLRSFFLKLVICDSVWFLKICKLSPLGHILCHNILQPALYWWHPLKTCFSHLADLGQCGTACNFTGRQQWCVFCVISSQFLLWHWGHWGWVFWVNFDWAKIVEIIHIQIDCANWRWNTRPIRRKPESSLMQYLCVAGHAILIPTWWEKIWEAIQDPVWLLACKEIQGVSVQLTLSSTHWWLGPSHS